METVRQGREITTKVELEAAKDRYIENITSIAKATEALARTHGFKGEGVALYHFEIPEDLSLYLCPKGEGDYFAYHQSPTRGLSGMLAINREHPFALSSITTAVSADGGTRFFFIGWEDPNLVFSLVLPERLDGFAITTDLPEGVQSVV